MGKRCATGLAIALLACASCQTNATRGEDLAAAGDAAAARDARSQERGPGAIDAASEADASAGRDVRAPNAADYVPEYEATAPTSQGRNALEQKTSNVQTEGCNSNFGLALRGAGTIAAVDVRLHAAGGGYAGCVKLRPAGGQLSPNLAAERYGQGWQWSTRANTGRHNPTQAGATEWLGAVVQLTQTPTRVEVAKNRVPLFQNQEFDFVQRESWWQDDFPTDGGDSDGDDFDEAQAWGSAFTSGDEVLSEIASSSRYEAQPTQNGIPAYAHRFYVAYELPPRALAQFTVVGTRSRDGALIYDPAQLPVRISTRRPGTPDATTYNAMVNSYGFRTDDAPGYRFEHYCGPDLALKPIPVSPAAGRVRTYTRILGDLDADRTAELYRTVSGTDLRLRETSWEPENKGLALMIVSTSPDADSGVAIGLYVPRSVANRRSVVGFDRAAGRLTFAENRRVQSAFLVVRDNNAGALQTNLVYRHIVAGLYPPDHASEGVTEMAYVDAALLFGTPREIQAAAAALAGAP